MRGCKHGCDVLDSRVFKSYFIKAIEHFFCVSREFSKVMQTETWSNSPSPSLRTQTYFRRRNQWQPEIRLRSQAISQPFSWKKCFVFIFFRRSVDGKHLTCFQSETSVFKFLRRSLVWTLPPTQTFFGLSRAFLGLSPVTRTMASRWHRTVGHSICKPLIIILSPTLKLESQKVEYRVNHTLNWEGFSENGLIICYAFIGALVKIEKAESVFHFCVQTPNCKKICLFDILQFVNLVCHRAKPTHRKTIIDFTVNAAVLIIEKFNLFWLTRSNLQILDVILRALAREHQLVEFHRQELSIYL